MAARSLPKSSTLVRNSHHSDGSPRPNVFFAITSEYSAGKLSPDAVEPDDPDPFVWLLFF